MNISFYMAARQRLIYGGQQSLAAAFLAKPDDDPLSEAFESAFQLRYETENYDASKVVELLIAELVDNGDQLPITNAEGYAAAQWLSTAPLANLPDPMPRAFVLYIAKAYKDRGTYPTLTSALEDFFANRDFV